MQRRGPGGAGRGETGDILGSRGGRRGPGWWGTQDLDCLRRWSSISTSSTVTDITPRIRPVVVTVTHVGPRRAANPAAGSLPPKPWGPPTPWDPPRAHFLPPPPAKDPACGDGGGTTLGVPQGEGMNWGRIQPGEGEGAGLGLNRVSGCRWGLRCAAAPLHPGPGDGDARVPPTPPWATSPSVARWWPLSPSTRRPTHGWRR